MHTHVYFALDFIITIGVRSTDKIKVEENVINIFFIESMFDSTTEIKYPSFCMTLSKQHKIKCWLHCTYV